MLTRRDALKLTAAAAAMPLANAAADQQPAMHMRPPLQQRRFTSDAVEAAITRVSAQIANPTLRTIFAQCLPNTLDTTVFTGTVNGKPDTYVITGDIDALWLRDSSAQVMPYVPFAREDGRLRGMIEGLIRRHARMVLLDSYANAFMRNPNSPPLSWSVDDRTDMHPGVGERKWEIDSLCYPVRLAHAYWKHTGDTAPFDTTWSQAAHRVVATFREQQRKTGPGPYHFQRKAESPTDTLPGNGFGAPARPNGMIFSGFRPSDDACTYPLFVPANLFAVRALGMLQEMATGILHDDALAHECVTLANEVRSSVEAHGVVAHPTHGRIYAYEIDGYSNANLMDDANAPGLLSLAYLECCPADDPLYRNTRAFALSEHNPYFFRGTAAEGIGGPHIGADFIWPMSITMRALTSQDDTEIAACLRMLCNTTAGTHFMHESFHKDDPSRYTRPWFAWANTLFGELVLKLHAQRPALLGRAYT